jgi:hypothetical protein
MKRIVYFFIATIVVLAGCFIISSDTGLASNKNAVLKVKGPVKISKDSKVSISGEGFQPGQKISILLTTEDGVETDIGYALKPVPQADDSGAWDTTFNCGRFIKKKLVKAGKSYSLKATNSGYETLAETAVSFME